MKTIMAASRAIEECTTSSSSANHKKKVISLLAIFCGLLYFVGLGSFGLLDRADAYYSEGAREMLEVGQWLIPQLNYCNFYDKPILIYWLQMLSYSAFGVNEFAARLPSACAATTLVFATYFFGKRFSDDSTGLKAAIIVATSGLVVGLARQSLVDMTFCLLLTSALYCAIERLSGGKRWLGALSYFCLGLAVLTKGPLAIALFGSVLGSYLLVTLCRSRSRFLSTLASLDIGLAVVILAVVALPWYIIAGLQTNGFWIDVFLIKGNLARISGLLGHSHPEWWFYLPVILYGFAPWIVFLPGALYRGAVTVRQYWNEKLPITARQEFILFLWCWFFGMLALVSIPSAKLHTYIVPLLPPAALLVACSIDDGLRYWKQHAVTPLTFKLEGVVCALAGVFAISVGCATAVAFGQTEILGTLPAKLSSALCEVLELLHWNGAILVSVSSILLGAALLSVCHKMLRNDPVGAVNILFLSLACASIIATPVAFDLAYRLNGADLHTAIRVLENRRDGEITVFNDFKPSVSFYLKRPTDSFFQPEDLIVDVPTSKVYVILKTVDTPRLAASPGSSRMLSHCDDWLVLEKSGVKLKKEPTLDEILKGEARSINAEAFILPFNGGEQPKR